MDSSNTKNVFFLGHICLFPALQLMFSDNPKFLETMWGIYTAGGNYPHFLLYALILETQLGLQGNEERADTSTERLGFCV